MLHTSTMVSDEGACSRETQHTRFIVERLLCVPLVWTLRRMSTRSGNQDDQKWPGPALDDQPQPTPNYR